MDVRIIVKNHDGEKIKVFLPPQKTGNTTISHLSMLNVDGAIIGENICASNNNESDEKQQNKNSIIFVMCPNQINKDVVIEYTIFFEENGSYPSWNTIITKEYIHFIGRFVIPMICPNVNDNDICDVHKIIKATFDWSSYEGKGWATWFHGNGDPFFEGTLEDILDSIYAIGLFEEQKFIIESNSHSGLQVRLVSYGFDETERRDAANVIRRTMAAVLDFWKEMPSRNFLVTLRKSISARSDTVHYQDTHGFTVNDNNSFSLVTLGGEDFQEQEFLKLIAHEFSHRWIVNSSFSTLSGARLFLEGFTEFVARQIVWRRGLITFKDYVEETNDILQSYFGALLFEAPEDDLDVFGSEALSYIRGDLLLMSWNYQLSNQRSNSGIKFRRRFQSFDTPIDQFIRAIVKSARRNRPLTLDHIFDVGNQFGLVDIEEQVQALIEGKNSIEIENWFEPCTRLGSIAVERINPGFDLVGSIRSSIVRHLNLDSPAAVSGLRKGDRIQIWELDLLNNKIILQISRDDEEHEISYQYDFHIIDAPQFLIDKKISHGKRCLDKMQSVPKN